MERQEQDIALITEEEEDKTVDLEKLKGGLTIGTASGLSEAARTTEITESSTPTPATEEIISPTDSNTDTQIVETATKDDEKPQPEQPEPETVSPKLEDEIPAKTTETAKLEDGFMTKLTRHKNTLLAAIAMLSLSPAIAEGSDQKRIDMMKERQVSGEIYKAASDKYTRAFIPEAVREDGKIDNKQPWFTPDSTLVDQILNSKINKAKMSKPHSLEGPANYKTLKEKFKKVGLPEAYSIIANTIHKWMIGDPKTKDNKPQLTSNTTVGTLLTTTTKDAAAIYEMTRKKGLSTKEAAEYAEDALNTEIAEAAELAERLAAKMDTSKIKEVEATDDTGTPIKIDMGNK